MLTRIGKQMWPIILTVLSTLKTFSRRKTVTEDFTVKVVISQKRHETETRDVTADH